MILPNELHTTKMQHDVMIVLRRSFGVDSRCPTMYALFLREKHADLYKEVMKHGQE